MRATAESGGSQVTVLKQGYLNKRSTNLRREWKRRFFVLDSAGVLYYYSGKVCVIVCLQIARSLFLQVGRRSRLFGSCMAAACCVPLNKVSPPESLTVQLISEVSRVRAESPQVSFSVALCSRSLNILHLSGV